MKKQIIPIYLLFSLIALTALADSNIDNTQKYAWSSQSGWVNFKPSHGGVTVYPDHLEGFAWSGNIGWISVGSYTDGGTHHYANTAAHDWGVNNDGLGNLSGYAWSPKVGWINFNPTHQQVTINMTTGEFKGYAWAANMGWIHLSQPPTYQVRANLPVPEPPPEIVTPPAIPATGLGRAILITASGAHRQNTLFKYSEALTRRMYRALKQRGYSDDEIIYLNPKKWQDIDGDGVDDEVVDYELFDPAADLESAFNQMTDLQAGQQFILYIHGHALSDQFKITREYWLAANELRRLVDKVPADVQQVIILDSCYSGSFIDELSAPQRIILTSSDAQNTAWNALYANFSDTFIRNVRRGENLQTAFIATEDMMISDPKLFGEQRPQLDDNGDGLFNSLDGSRAAGIVIGNIGSRAADAPEIIDIHSPIQLTSEQAEGWLWVKTSPGPENIRRVRAILIRPGIQITDYQGDNTVFERIEVEMDSISNRYAAAYNGFYQAGVWRVMYQAQGLDGTWSDTAFGEVQASGVGLIVARMNQSSYQIGEHWSFKLDINATAAQPGPYDIYAAIIFPTGYYITLSYSSSGPILPGAVNAYRENVPFEEPKSLSILDLDLPVGIELGTYQACGVLTAAGNEPIAENWVGVHCQDFEVR